jgi:hypothetical protein
MIVGLCSSFREGRLAESAVRSLLPACDRVVVLEGPIGDAPTAGPATDWPSVRRAGRVLVKEGRWGSDAEKRTAMLHEAKRGYATYNERGASRGGPGLWGVILDGDEVLLHGELLPDYLDALPAEALGFSLHLMELDGSCSYIPNRVLRLDRITRWILSSYAFEIDGVAVSKPNVKILDAGEPDSAEWVDVGDGHTRQRRRPLAGEPHILHRSVLRPAERQARVQRQHEAEAESFEELLGGAPVGADADPGGVKIWLPG